MIILQHCLLYFDPPSLFCFGVQNIACKIITPLKIKEEGAKYSGSHYRLLHRYQYRRILGGVDFHEQNHLILDLQLQVVVGGGFFGITPLSHCKIEVRLVL